MSSIDAILDRMAERGAQALELRQGAIPIVRVDGAAVPVQHVRLTSEQVVALARPMAGPEDAARLDRREACAFRYRDFDVRVTFGDVGASVVVVPRPDVLARAAPTELAPPSAPGDFVLAAPVRALSSVREARTSSPPPRASVPPTQAAPPGEPRAPSPATEPPAWARPATPRATAVKAAAAGVLALGVAAWYLWPVALPDLVLADAEGRTASLTELHAGRRDLVVVFVMDDPVSQFAVDQIKTAYPKKSGKTAFLALVFGDANAAEQKRKDLGLPFPAYGVRAAKDPFALQTFVQKAGASRLVGAAMYGGTTILVDGSNRMRWKLEQEGVQKLSDKLAKLPD
jgi:hypothetical protein